MPICRWPTPPLVIKPRPKFELCELTALQFVHIEKMTCSFVCAYLIYDNFNKRHNSTGSIFWIWKILRCILWYSPCSAFGVSGNDTVTWCQKNIQNIKNTRIKTRFHKQNPRNSYRFGDYQSCIELLICIPVKSLRVAQFWRSMRMFPLLARERSPWFLSVVFVRSVEWVWLEFELNFDEILHPNCRYSALLEHFRRSRTEHCSMRNKVPPKLWTQWTEPFLRPFKRIDNWLLNVVEQPFILCLIWVDLFKLVIIQLNCANDREEMCVLSNNIMDQYIKNRSISRIIMILDVVKCERWKSLSFTSSSRFEFYKPIVINEMLSENWLHTFTNALTHIATTKSIKCTKLNESKRFYFQSDNFVSFLTLGSNINKLLL